MRKSLFSLVTLLAVTPGCSDDGEGPAATQTPAETQLPTATPEQTPATPESSLEPSPVSTSTPEPTPPATEAPSPTPVPTHCDPPLMLEPEEKWVLPYTLVTLFASGGSGSYAFELESAPSGAILNEITGVYLSGADTGDDVVVLSDASCDDQARARIHVVGPLEITPDAVTLQPGISFAYEISGGSGDTRCSLVENVSGGKLDSQCRYTAGSAEGRDIVRFEDFGTGEQVEAEVMVSQDAGLSAHPDWISVPVGSSFTPEISGGSGRYSFITGETVSSSGSTLTALLEGDEAVEVVDDFTGARVDLRVTTLEPQRASFARAGDRTSASRALLAGDLTGDGYPEILLAVSEADNNGYNTGAVFVYSGEPGGIQNEPIQVLSGVLWEDYFGMDMAIGDLNGDSLPDLAVGVQRHDAGGGDSGAVQLFAGEADGHFATTPWLTIPGESSGDYFGQGLATGDFDGDGILDLAVGAQNDEESNSGPYEQGAVFVYYNSPAGLNSAYDQRISGRAPDGSGGYAVAGSMRLGLALAVGDFNGDGIDDLAAGGYEYDRLTSNDGALQLFLGQQDQGLMDQPARLWTPTQADQGSHFGRSLAMADLDGDGFDDLVVGAPRFKPDLSKNNYNGAVRMYRGQALEPVPASAWTPSEESDWFLVGDASDDYFGSSVIVTDASGDGYPDLCLGNLYDEMTNGVGNSGTVQYYVGTPGALPGTTPSRVFSGLRSGDQFGQSFVFLPDLDGDDVPDLFSFAGRDDTLGYELGLPYFVWSRLDFGYDALDFPGGSAGQLLGYAGAFVGDVDGNGFSDLILGAPSADFATNLINAGGVYFYPGSAAGFSQDSTTTLSAVTSIGDNDQLGYSVSSAGDFNRDGRPDFALLARNDDRPSSFDETQFSNPTACPGDKSDTSSVLIFTGQSGAPGTRAAFIHYGSQANNPLQVVAGGGDFNGDGYDDVLLSSPSWNRGDTSDVGGYALLYGRAASSDGKTTVLCDADFTFLGTETNARVGYSAGFVGDLDGDGCDELAVGGSGEDVGLDNQGTLRVVFGFGSRCTKNKAQQVVLASGERYSQSGFALSGGVDVNADGVPDIAVGAPYLQVSGTELGGAWIISGAYVRGLTREDIVDGQSVSTTSPYTSSGATWRVTGRTSGEQFGRSVALVPDFDGSGRGALVVGSPFGDWNGFRQGGGALLFGLTSSDGSYVLDGDPELIVGGESEAVDGRLGEWLQVGVARDKTWLLMGGSRADGLGRDQGAAYLVPLLD